MNDVWNNCHFAYFTTTSVVKLLACWKPNEPNEIDRGFELRVNPKTMQLLFVASLLGIKVKEKRMIRSKLNYVSWVEGHVQLFQWASTITKRVDLVQGGKSSSSFHWNVSCSRQDIAKETLDNYHIWSKYPVCQRQKIIKHIWGWTRGSQLTAIFDDPYIFRISKNINLQKNIEHPIIYLVPPQK